MRKYFSDYGKPNTHSVKYIFMESIQLYNTLTSSFFFVMLNATLHILVQCFRKPDHFLQKVIIKIQVICDFKEMSQVV